MKKYLFLLFMFFAANSFAQIKFMDIPLGLPLDEMTRKLRYEKKLTLVSQTETEAVFSGSFWKFYSRNIEISHKKDVKNKYGEGTNHASVKIDNYAGNRLLMMNFIDKMSEKYGTPEHWTFLNYESYEWTVDGGQILLGIFKDKNFARLLYIYIPGMSGRRGSVDSDL